MGNHFNLLHIALLIAVFSSAVHGKINQGAKCKFLNSSPGICGFVEDCPLLSAIWNEVTQETPIFKSLICGEDYATGEALVCCPKSENDKDKSNVDAKIEDQPVLDDNKIYFPDDPIFAEENDDDDDVDVDDFHRNSYESHRNFHLLPSLNECGSRKSLPFERIIGGKNAGHGDYPWLAQIGYLDEETKEIIFDCGGAVLNKNFILTAAHCLHHKSFKPVVVRLAEYNISTEADCSKYFNCSTVKDFEIENIIIHDNYEMDTADRLNDIALIRIKHEITFDTPFIRPICLPFGKDYDIVSLLDEDSTTKQMSIAAGWGRTNWMVKNGSDTLQHVFLPINTLESCKEAYEDMVKISPKQICVGGEIGHDSCSGDSGGPIMIPLSIRTRKNAFTVKIFQLGVISFGPTECGEHPVPGIATRVTAYLDWILNNISS